MSVSVDVYQDRVMLVFLKKGMVKNIHPMSVFEARLLAQNLLERAGELEDNESQANKPS